jgi:nitrate reductase NapE component
MFLRYWTKGDWQNREKLIQAMLDHNEHIREIVPKDNLLEWNLADGWEPLCEFLGKPVPDVPVPYINIGASDAPRHKNLAIQRLIIILGRMLIRPALVAALITAVGFGVWMYIT